MNTRSLSFLSIHMKSSKKRRLAPVNSGADGYAVGGRRTLAVARSAGAGAGAPGSWAGLPARAAWAWKLSSVRWHRPPTRA